MTLLDADHHILASLGMNSRVGEVFNPENILNAAANVTIDEDSVWLSGILTYTDLMKETPPLYFDRESQRDMAMKVSAHKALLECFSVHNVLRTSSRFSVTLSTLRTCV
jgi:hypothetical protein